MQISTTPRAIERPPQRGFTTIELMMVVGIMAVLAAVALPNFRDVLERYRVRRAVEDFTSSFYLARSEAIKRGGRVAIIKADPAAANCAGSSWSCGWKVIFDRDGNGVLDAADSLLMQSDLPANVSVVRNSNVTSGMLIDRWGDVAGAGILSFVFSYDRGADVPATASTKVCVSAGGRLRSPC